jgi:hypothetical protein
VSHGYVDHLSGAAFRFVSPDYFRLVPWQGSGMKPVGYGYDSVEAIVGSALRVNAAGELGPRREVLGEIDQRGIIATPANSSINELVVEAARMSIAQGGRHAEIVYEPQPSVRLRS